MGNNRGVAILMTLSVVTLLITATLELNRRVRAAVFSTAATRDRLTRVQMAASGIHAAMAMLVRDKTASETDSLQEDWANPEKIGEVLQDIPFEDGKITVEISDELGRIQVNALLAFPDSQKFSAPQRILWDRFLRFATSQEAQQDDEDHDPTAIINSIKDWLDSGDDEAITGLTGAESDYYQGLEPPYSCRNAPFTHINELVRVKGVTPELFHGVGETPGISGYLTVHGITDTGRKPFEYGGKININTAELPVLKALLPTGNEELARIMLEYRQEISDAKYVHDLSNPTWYKSIPGFSDVEIDPSLITTSSDVFRIEATASLHAMETTAIAVVKREKNSTTGKWFGRALSWQAE